MSLENELLLVSLDYTLGELFLDLVDLISKSLLNWGYLLIWGIQDLTSLRFIVLLWKGRLLHRNTDPFVIFLKWIWCRMTRDTNCRCFSFRISLPCFFHQCGSSLLSFLRPIRLWSSPLQRSKARWTISILKLSGLLRLLCCDSLNLMNWLVGQTKDWCVLSLLHSLLLYWPWPFRTWVILLLPSWPIRTLSRSHWLGELLSRRFLVSRLVKIIAWVVNRSSLLTCWVRSCLSRDWARSLSLGRLLRAWSRNLVHTTCRLKCVSMHHNMCMLKRAPISSFLRLVALVRLGVGSWNGGGIKPRRTVESCSGWICLWLSL